MTGDYKVAINPANEKINSLCHCQGPSFANINGAKRFSTINLNNSLSYLQMEVEQTSKNIS